nr:MAG TPA: hypothetical protein [Crassvirales sp.]
MLYDFLYAKNLLPNFHLSYLHYYRFFLWFSILLKQLKL